MQLRAFFAIFKSRSIEFLRDRGALLWNILLPFILITAFALIFESSSQTVFQIGTLGRVPENFPVFHYGGIEQIDYTELGISEELALDRLRKHQISMYINFDTGTYYINEYSASTDILRRLFSEFTSNTSNSEQSLRDSFGLSEAQVSGMPVRYSDWVLPGVLSFNMMFSCLFGVGYLLIRYRKNGVLKRIHATPISATTFICAQAFSRFIIVFLSILITFLGTNLIFSFTINGNIFDLLVVTSLGILSMIALGLLFASRIKNEELGGGLINFLIWPLMIISEVYFTLDTVPVFQTIGRIFPLSHLIQGVRAIMIDGAGLLQILPNILYLSVFTVLAIVLASLLFRWE